MASSQPFELATAIGTYGQEPDRFGRAFLDEALSTQRNVSSIIMALRAQLQHQ